MYTENAQKESLSRTIQPKHSSRVYMEDNRPGVAGQAKMIDNVQKQNESMKRICQQKKALSHRVADRTLAQKWQPARVRAMKYVDPAVSDWIDCAIKLGIPAMKSTQFGHGSGKKKDGSEKADDAYAKLRETCRKVAKVDNKYTLTQLHKNGK